jgi:methylase of polypeptide subunit release factors
MRTQTIKLTPDVATVLADSRIDGNVLFLPDRTLDRKLYVAVNKVLENLGAKWNRSRKGHVFPPDVSPEELVNDAQQNGHVIDQKKSFQFFGTPTELADQMVDFLRLDLIQNPQLLAPTSAYRILEPSAGDGSLVLAIRRQYPNLSICAIDIDPVRVKKLMHLGQGIYTSQQDFLQYETDELFSHIIMNPPFTGNQDIDHVNHAWDLLRPGGTLVAIMSAHVSFANDRKSKDFRTRVTQYGWMTKNDPRAFAESGTNVETMMVVLHKP